MKVFSRFDTILAVKGNNEIIHQGFLLGYFKSYDYTDSCLVKTVYLVKCGERDTKKFYGKKKTIKINSTRIVLTEKIRFDKKYKTLDF